MGLEEPIHFTEACKAAGMDDGRSIYGSDISFISIIIRLFQVATSLHNTALCVYSL